MLTVAVHHQCERAALGKEGLETGLQGGAFAEGCYCGDDLGTGLSGAGGGGVGGVVVDDENPGQELAGDLDQFGHSRLFVQARHDDAAFSFPVHDSV
jgi:hypothetical protein